MTAPLYTRDMLRLAASIPHHARLAEPHATAEKRSPICGSRVTIDVRIEDGRVVALGQEVRACALGQASAALMGESALGRTPDQLARARDALAAYLAGEADDPGDWPGLAQFDRARGYAARHAAIRLPFEAIAEAAAKATLSRPGSGQG